MQGAGLTTQLVVAVVLVTLVMLVAVAVRVRASRRLGQRLLATLLGVAGALWLLAAVGFVVVGMGSLGSGGFGGVNFLIGIVAALVAGGMGGSALVIARRVIQGTPRARYLALAWCVLAIGLPRYVGFPGALEMLGALLLTSDWHLDSDGRLVGWFATSAVEVTLRLALLVSAALVGVAALALPSSDSPSSRATESEQGGSAAS